MGVLSLLIALPLLAACLCLFVTAPIARWVALGATLVNFALGLFLWCGFEVGGDVWQFREFVPLFGRFSWALGIDGIALLLIMLTLVLMPICILASWQSVEKRVPEYMAAFLVMEATMVGVFAAQDLLLFYVFFEAGLIPMYLIIGIWGGAERIYAAYKFFLYTLVGSVLMLIAMMWMIATAGTTDIPTLMAYNFPVHAQYWLWLAFFASFAVKMPMWPVHTWLPAAHVQAPTAGSVILAGVLLKMGGYGFIRFLLPMFPAGTAHWFWLVMGLSLCAVVITSLIALVQSDMKKLIAYSSVAHMAFVTMGLFAFNQNGIEGAMMVMLGHGVVSGALFLCVGVIYDRMHTREIAEYGGLAATMPRYATIFLLFTMASIGLPGTSNFVGEFLTLAGVYQINSTVAVVATTGVVLGAAYMLILYRRVAFGPVTNPKVPKMPDLSAREMTMFAPLIVLVFWMGIYPESFIAPMRRDVAMIVDRLAPTAPQSDARIQTPTPHAGAPHAGPAGHEAPAHDGGASQGTGSTHGAAPAHGESAHD